MKKLLCVLCAIVLMAGCSSGISPAEYERVVSERDALREELDAVKASDSQSSRPIESSKAESQNIVSDSASSVKDFKGGITASEFVDRFVESVNAHGLPLNAGNLASPNIKDGAGYSIVSSDIAFIFSINEDSGHLTNVIGEITIDTDDADKSIMLMHGIIRVSNNEMGETEITKLTADLFNEALDSESESSLFSRYKIVYYLKLESEDRFSLMVCFDD